MVAPLLLLTATLLYAGYNLLIKVSGSHVPEDATSTVLGVICLQLAALTTSITYAGSLFLFRGDQHLQLTTPAYLWALAAGFCIGGAEIAYFYLKPMPASIAIPTIVSGTIVVTLLISFVVLREPLNWNQWLGSGCIVLGIALLFLNREAAPA
jgi:drug/metabolite transporter (DMT)-like permease